MPREFRWPDEPRGEKCSIIRYVRVCDVVDYAFVLRVNRTGRIIELGVDNLTI